VLSNAPLPGHSVTKTNASPKRPRPHAWEQHVSGEVAAKRATGLGGIHNINPAPASDKHCRQRGADRVSHITHVGPGSHAVQVTLGAFPTSIRLSGVVRTLPCGSVTNLAFSGRTLHVIAGKHSEHGVWNADKRARQHLKPRARPSNIMQTSREASAPSSSVLACTTLASTQAFSKSTSCSGTTASCGAHENRRHTLCGEEAQKRAGALTPHRNHALTGNLMLCSIRKKCAGGSPTACSRLYGAIMKSRGATVNVAQQSPQASTPSTGTCQEQHTHTPPGSHSPHRSAPLPSSRTASHKQQPCTVHHNGLKGISTA
jgi:hypothetical protein